MQPRQMFDTCMPVLPNFTVFMPLSLSFHVCHNDRTIRRFAAKRDLRTGRSIKREQEAPVLDEGSGRGLGLLDRPRRHFHRRDRTRMTGQERKDARMTAGAWD